MNTENDHDRALLDQIDRSLEHGIPAEDALINRLADTLPQANIAFQQDLEHKLMAQIESSQFRKPKERRNMNFTMTATALPRTTRPTSTWIASWAVTFAIFALITIIVIGLNRAWSPAQPAALLTQSEIPVQIVIATQNIPAGTLITTEMLGTITLSVADMAKLTADQPDHAFVSDITAVVGQTAALDIGWFQPIATELLGEVINPCALPDASCSVMPQGYFTIGLPLQPDTLQGLTIGDRVDVLASTAGELRVIVANVLITNVSPESVMLAAPSWQHSILVWLYTTDLSYALRLHTGTSSTLEPNIEPTDYTFTAPEALPDGYVFDLVVTLPVAEGYLLTGLPTSIDHIQFTGADDGLTFWFTELEVVSIEDGTSVTIRLPQRGADILAYLIENEADMTFIPQAG